MPLRIRPFVESDRNQVLSLYDREFGREAGERFARRWDWQFVANPAAATLPSLLWVADHDDEVVGFLGSFPVRQKVFDRELVWRRGCDLMVGADARREDPTIVLQLLAACRHSAGNELFVGIGYNPQHGAIQRLLHHRPLDSLPLYIRPYDGGAMLRFLLASRRIPRVVEAVPLRWAIPVLASGLTALAAATNRLRTPPVPHQVTALPAREVDDEFDALWQTLHRSFPIITVRDRVFVRWRFLEDPVFDHTILTARDGGGKLLGYLALRVSTTRGMPVGRILDLFCSPVEPGVALALLRAALERFRQARVALVSCFGLLDPLRSLVRRYLYLKPGRWQQPVMTLWNGDPTMSDAVYDAANWHLSHADGDLGFSP